LRTSIRHLQQFRSKFWRIRLGMKKVLSVGLIVLCLGNTAFAQTDKTLIVLKNVFSDYVKYQESTDSEINKRKFINALQQVKNNQLTSAIPLLLDIYLYYYPTDFPTREYVLDVFYSMRGAALVEVERKLIIERKKIKSEEDWPYDELLYLKEKLQ
jgi:hypothetical protein